MAVSRGKQFEQQFKSDFQKVSGGFIYRLPDQVNGHKTTSANICDFVCYIYPNIFLMEVKTISGNTFPLTNFTQFEKLRSFRNIPGLRKGVLIWYTERDKIIYVPIKTIEKMVADGKKSVNIRTIDEDGYEYLNIPSVKKRVFLDSDYSVLCNLPEDW